MSSIFGKGPKFNLNSNPFSRGRSLEKISSQLKAFLDLDENSELKTLLLEKKADNLRAFLLDSFNPTEKVSLQTITAFKKIIIGESRPFKQKKSFDAKLDEKHLAAITQALRGRDSSPAALSEANAPSTAAGQAAAQRAATPAVVSNELEARRNAPSPAALSEANAPSTAAGRAAAQRAATPARVSYELEARGNAPSSAALSEANAPSSAALSEANAPSAAAGRAAAERAASPSSAAGRSEAPSDVTGSSSNMHYSTHREDSLSTEGRRGRLSQATENVREHLLEISASQDNDPATLQVMAFQKAIDLGLFEHDANELALNLVLEIVDTPRNADEEEQLQRALAESLLGANAPVDQYATAGTSSEVDAELERVTEKLSEAERVVAANKLREKRANAAENRLNAVDINSAPTESSLISERVAYIAKLLEEGKKEEEFAELQEKITDMTIEKAKLVGKKAILTDSKSLEAARLDIDSRDTATKQTREAKARTEIALVAAEGRLATALSLGTSDDSAQQLVDQLRRQSQNAQERKEKAEAANQAAIDDQDAEY